MNRRHFGIEDGSPTGFFELIIFNINGRQEFGGGVNERSRVSVIMVCARAAPKEGVILALSRQAFARLLLADFELALWSRRVVALWQVYVRSLPTCLSLLYYILMLLWLSTALRLFVYFQVNTVVSYLWII